MTGILEGKVAIVTGSGRGIGRGEALLLAKEGAKVVVNDMGGQFDGTGAHHGPADEVVQEIKDLGGEAVANYDSVADFEGAKRIVDTAINAFGKLDILVNNAGILRDKMIFSMSEEEWDAVLNVHLKGTFNCTRHACVYWREMHKAGTPVSGRVINTTSDAGLLYNVSQANYAVAKIGIAALAIITAKEMGKYGVTANAIAPVARTRLTVGAGGGGMPPPEAIIKKMGYDVFDPENTAPLVAYLASDDASGITGQVLRIGGGIVWLLQSWHSIGKIEKKGRWAPAELGPELKKLVQSAPPREEMVDIFGEMGLGIG